MSNEIQKTTNSPLSMAAEFIKKDSNVDVDKLAKLLEVQERWEANEAKKAYVEAMAAFKKDPPQIFKDRHVKFNTSKGVTEYYHASLQNVTTTLNEALSKHGLTASWETSQGEATVSVTCKITHIFGHSEQTTLSSGLDNSGSKNPIQALGSTVSYLQRYTLLALTGLATEEQDDDGNAASKKGKEQEPEIKWSDKQLDVAEKLKVALEENLDGTPIDLEKLKTYLVWQSKHTGKPLPDDDKKVTPLVKFILQKPETLTALKGEAA